ncbi:MAG TPA: pyridoxine 5'-phosphate synthase [Gemmatimonadaceae bacterium]|nr:pyridoxine 5'-phosphate synthase [Gemmatimonadaceae bacterium]
MAAKYQRLFINIDHVATIRQARRADEPDPVAAALVCEGAGADGITAHLREDRRHIQDADMERLAASITTALNFEMALSDPIVDLAERLRPREATIVPERREEVTTEGGLDVSHDPERLARAIERFRSAGVRVSLFIDPDADTVRRSRDLGVDAIELHTGRYAHHPGDPAPLEALVRAAELAATLGLAVHAGHGLTLANVGGVSRIPEVEELNIGHSIVSRSVFTGIGAAVREMRVAMDRARGAGPE